jgi:hypothetical protein
LEPENRLPIAKSAGKAVFGDVLGGIVNAPVFWYTRGALDAASFCWKLVVRQWKVLGVGVWIVNIFVPMYAQRDAAGMIISFFMRLIQIFARTIAFLVCCIAIGLLYVAYLIAPVFIFIQLLRQLAGVIAS